MTDAVATGTSRPNLAAIHQDAMKAANASWSETDKLYVSVCSALVALASLFSNSTFGSRSSAVVVGLLVLLLSANWFWLIRRYRRKIGAALEGLASAHKGSEAEDYYCEEQQRFANDKSDYLIVLVVFLVSLVMIFYPTACILCGRLCA